VQTTQDRIAAVWRVLADPPQVHPRTNGAWSTDPACYEYMASIAKAGVRTLETGLGVSTVLFAIWGCKHTCVVHQEAEVAACRQYFTSRGISDTNITFHVGPSERVLPNLDLHDLDLVFIDGCHGFPVPTIDWFYAASMLRAGGVAVLDDAQLRQVRLGLFEFLNRDPRWTKTRRRRKWIAYERKEGGALSEEWAQQAFLGAPMLDRYEGLIPAAIKPVAKAAGRRLRLL
jgi:Methyltransferase domain